MLQFKINEIPKGKSEQHIPLASDALDLDGLQYQNLALDVVFDRREAGLQVSFTVSGEVELVCDRSLDTFWHPTQGKYSVLYKEAADFESEDDEISVRRFDVSGNIITIETEVRDTLLLSLPLRRVHPRFYNDDGELTHFELESGSSQQETDPRWDILKRLKDNTTNN
jgi:uncharacterized metal-binding protein YceD (DUF177 family)